MIPRLEHQQGLGLRQVDWPDNPNPNDPKRDTTLFSGRPPFRKMMILADHDAIPSATTNFSKEWLLAGFLSHPYVRVYHYLDDGPPRSMPRRSYADGFAEAYEGWAVVDNSAKHSTPGSTYGLTLADEKTVWETAIFGDPLIGAKENDTFSSYSGLSADVRSHRTMMDALATQVANASQADMFLTNRELVHELYEKYRSCVTPITPDKALPLVSLFVRSQGQYLYYIAPDDGGYGTMNKGMYFWVGARELLPAAWRWVHACNQNSAHTGDDEIAFIANSLVTRVKRALQARDGVHIAMNMQQNNDTADDALSNLDDTLLLLMGAIDAAARVAHMTLNITDGIHNAGWQRKTWIKRVRSECPTLADVVRQGAPCDHALTILTSLRNSVHGESLAPLGVQKHGRRHATMVSLPRSSRDRVLKAIDSLGGRELWGVEAMIPNKIHTDPGVLLDQLFPLIMNLLNELMSSTPVEQMAGVSLRPSDLVPPDDPMSPFAERVRHSIRWQLGL